jgi:hypothetical protein
MTDTTARLVPRSQRAWDNFRRRVAEMHGEVLELTWLGKSVFHRCRCTAAGHLFSLQPANARQNRGACPVCVREVRSLRLLEDFRWRIAAYSEQKIKVALKMAGAEPLQGKEYFSEENLALILNEIAIWTT